MYTKNIGLKLRQMGFEFYAEWDGGESYQNCFVYVTVHHDTKEVGVYALGLTTNESERSHN